MEKQRADGGWDEDLSTGTGFPRVFYLKYHSVPKFVSGAGAAAYRKARRSQLAADVRSQRSFPHMRVPFRRWPSMATYIAKNKMRPRPEWQKNLAAERRCERIRSASSTRRFLGQRASASRIR